MWLEFRRVLFRSKKFVVPISSCLKSLFSCFSPLFFNLLYLLSSNLCAVLLRFIFYFQCRFQFTRIAAYTLTPLRRLCDVVYLTKFLHLKTFTPINVISKSPKLTYCISVLNSLSSCSLSGNWLKIVYINKNPSKRAWTLFEGLIISLIKTWSGDYSFTLTVLPSTLTM